MKKITVEEVIEKINNNDYLSKLPYPSGKSDETRQQRMEYHRDNNRLYELFKEDALAATGILGHKKAGKAFEIASDHDGRNLTDTLYLLEEIAELLK